MARVVDGDTLELDGRERVRLIGVDAPERASAGSPAAAFAEESTAFAARLVSGQRVRLEFESNRRDAYGRTLAYVFLEDGTLLNLEIVRSGHARAYTRFPFERSAEFRAAEREARAGRRGLWRLDESPAAPARSVRACVPAGQCCRVCRASRACGDACITASGACHTGDGCACDAADVCR